MKEALIHPKHPERICWGCERYCAADNLACREERLAHPIESYGYDWLELEQANATERVEPPLFDGLFKKVRGDLFISLEPAPGTLSDASGGRP
jgi:hypothetical protein